ncbi:MAG TPA: hypothetical protein VFX23_00475 [Limnobacter sp.]|uniref:hypothetical protein n=1 Tax=Limnobacter sp. TaxID=2003368 RepID=UPI002E370D79|nr:hypothetical protein [Limnobacter sp.]HEX5484446.1 hypothetical protein [Limnobacter sp.]
MPSKIFQISLSIFALNSLLSCQSALSKSNAEKYQLPPALERYQQLKKLKIDFTPEVSGELLLLKEPDADTCLGALFVQKDQQWTFDELSQRFLDAVPCNTSPKNILGKYIPYNGDRKAIRIPANMLPKAFTPDLNIKTKTKTQYSIRHTYEGFADGFYLLVKKPSDATPYQIFKLPSPSELEPYPGCKVKNATLLDDKMELKVRYSCTLVGPDHSPFEETSRYRQIDGNWSLN